MHYLKKIFITLLIASFFLSQLSWLKNCQAFMTGEVVINEIAWMGSPASYNNEWMELYNPTENDIDLAGWSLIAEDGTPSIMLIGKILAKNYFLIERSSDEPVPNIPADFIYSGVLGNSGEILKLRDDKNILIDTVVASSSWPGGDNITKATMERNNLGEWATSLIPGGTPKAENSLDSEAQASEPYCGDGIINEDEECDNGNDLAGDGCSNNCLVGEGDEYQDNELSATSSEEEIETGDVLINEFLSNPDGEDIEWIELYNASGRELILENWSITEGSQSTTTINGVLGVKENERFLVIEKPKGNLNNNGDKIVLSDGNGSLIDSVAYGGWDDGDKGNNAILAEDGASSARRSDGLNTFDNNEDFAVTITPTKGGANIITKKTIINNQPAVSAGSGSNASVSQSEAYDYSEDIVISEIFPNPDGDESEGEFIELYNAGDREVDLAGWSLANKANKKYYIKKESAAGSDGSSNIKPKGYFIVPRVLSLLVLNNTGDTIKLFQPLKDQPQVEITYDKALEGWSYNLKGILDLKTGSIASAKKKNNWVWSKKSTPGYLNVIEEENNPPEAGFSLPEKTYTGVSVKFDGSASFDPDGGQLVFGWDFGDGNQSNLVTPENTYSNAGKYSVKLTVSDGKSSSTVKKNINVLENLLIKNTAKPVVLSISDDIGNVKVIINELLPNPAGDDKEGEWLELKNTGKSKINLLNWKIEKGDTVKKAYIINMDNWLLPGDFFVLKRNLSKLTLNNTADSVRLYSDQAVLKDKVSYNNAKEGWAYARDAKGDWAWTISLTSGSENRLDGGVLKKVKAKTGSSGSKKSSLPSYLSRNLENVNEFKTGDKIITKGIVAVMPGILGSQYFYIVGSPGIQIYNYKKEFPSLKVGDQVEVRGEISEANGEKRIKTSGKDDIRILGHLNPPSATVYSCEELKEEQTVRLVTVSGEIIKKQGTIIYLDDGSEEAIIYIKKGTGIDLKNFKTGDNIKATGILAGFKAERRILPRHMGDITKIEIASIRDKGAVLGEVATNTELRIAERNKKAELFQYILITAIGLIAVLTGWIIKKRKNN